MKKFGPTILIFTILWSCNNFDLTKERVEQDFKLKYPTYKFISVTFENADNDEAVAIIILKKPIPELSNKNWISKWKYKKNANIWVIKENGEKTLIEPLPPLTDTPMKHALRIISLRHIMIDTVYKDHPLFKSEYMLDRIVLDVQFKGESIGDQVTYIPEGEKVTLVVNK